MLPHLLGCLGPFFKAAMKRLFPSSTVQMPTWQTIIGSFWKQSVAKMSYNFVVYQQRRSLHYYYYWKYSNLLICGMQFKYYLCLLHGLCAVSFEIVETLQAQQVIVYHRANCTFWFSIISATKALLQIPYWQFSILFSYVRVNSLHILLVVSISVLCWWDACSTQVCYANIWTWIRPMGELG